MIDGLAEQLASVHGAIPGLHRPGPEGTLIEMPSTTLVGYSNLGALLSDGGADAAMLAFAAYLAALGPVATTRGRRREKELARPARPRRPSLPATRRPRERRGRRTPQDGRADRQSSAEQGTTASQSARARKLAGIAMSLAWLGTLLLVASGACCAAWP